MAALGFNMEFNFFSILILMMLAVWIFQASKIALSQKKLNWKAAVNFFASACLVVGAVGFFGSALSSTVGFGKSESFEWPIGKTDSALIFPSGHIVVPHDPSGRVQVYDKGLNFLRGWSISAGGGVFQLHPAYPPDGATFFVYTARGDMKFHYDLKGNLISSKKYNGSYPKKSIHASSVSVPTPLYLLVFTHPFASWFVAALGMALLYFMGGYRVKKT